MARKKNGKQKPDSDIRTYKGITERSVLYNAGLVAVLAFGAGWGAYLAVQKASGRVDVSVEHLKALEERAKLGKETILYENDLLQGRIEELEKERTVLNQTLLANIPKGESYVTKVALSPASPATLKIHEPVNVQFEYVVAEGRRASIFATDATPLEERKKISIPGSKEPAVLVMSTVQSSPYQASPYLSGKGKTSRYLYRDTVGEIKKIAVRIYDEESRDQVYEMTIPVQYTYK